MTRIAKSTGRTADPLLVWSVLPALLSCGGPTVRVEPLAGLGSTEPPGPPTALSPETGHATGSPHAPATANVLRPLFRWAPPADAAASPVTYEVQVDDSCSRVAYASCDFASPEASAADLSSDRWRPESELPVSRDRPVGRRYFWRVRACRNTACSDWAPTRYLDVGRVRTDVNGDGYGDVVLAAFGAALSRIPDDRVFVHLGGPAGPSPEPDAELVDPSGQGHTGFGGAAVVAGDLDADGFAEIVVGAWNSETTEYRAGRAWVFFGNAEAHFGRPEVRLEAPEARSGAQFGDEVAGAGDVDGDGCADVVVGASHGGADGAGRAYVFLGNRAGPGIELADPDRTPASRFGVSVAHVGDVNHDGHADVVVGAPRAGRAFVYAGGPSGIASAPLATLAAGATEQTGFGYEVAGAGDLDGDGRADLLVGIQGASRALVFAGGPEGPAATPNVTLEDPAPGAPLATFGDEIAALGDMDGDGLDDVAIGSRTAAGDAGLAFVFRGAPAGPSVESSTTLECPPDRTGALFGWSIVPSADANGDGFADLVVVAPRRSDADGAIAFFYAGGASGIAPTPASALQAGGPPSSSAPIPARGHVSGTTSVDLGAVPGDDAVQQRP